MLPEQEAIKTITEENAAAIPGWKDKHKQLKAVAFFSKVHSKWCPFIVAKPTATVMDAIAKYSSQDKTEKIDEVLRESCVKAGDKSLFESDVDLKSSVFKKITSMLEDLQEEEKEL